MPGADCTLDQTRSSVQKMPGAKCTLDGEGLSASGR